MLLTFIIEREKKQRLKKEIERNKKKVRERKK